MPPRRRPGSAASRRPVPLAALILGLLALAGGAPPAVAGPGPGPGPDPAPVAGEPGPSAEVDCLDCHTEMEAVIDRAVAHLPVLQGECTACHAPHAARYPHLLNVRERALCFSCHTEEAGDFMTGRVHTPVKQGRCTACHEAHGSENASLLVAKGSDLCFRCHEAEQEKQTWPTPHEPFIGGDCTICHDPHNSPNDNQLLAPASWLCGVCHDVEEASVVQAHHGIPVEGTRCSGCHEPHASQGDALVLPVAHFPFALGQCDACHLVDSDTPQLVSSTGGRLCAECHDDYPRADDPVVHPPVAQGACLACHSPHASRQESLLLEDPRQVCLQCHQDVQERWTSSRSAHPLSVQGGACTACHQPHSSSDPALLSAGEIRTCLGCHETQRHGHPLGSDRIDPRTGKGITCVTCHDPHGTEFPYQLRGDQSRGLCVECHNADLEQAGEAPGR